MIGWILFVYFMVTTIAEEGVLAAIGAVISAVGVDVAVALLFGGSVSSLLLGAGLADDVVFWAFSRDLGFLEKVALTEFTHQVYHIEHEAQEHHDHTDYENRQYARYLRRHFPNQTFLFGDVTTGDLIDFGLTGGYLIHQRTFTTLLDAAKDKFGGVVEKTAEIIEIGGG